MPLVSWRTRSAAHDAARATHERTLLAIIQAYRNINDRTHREIDDAIESLPTLEQIHQQLVTDDLPLHPQELADKGRCRPQPGTARPAAANRRRPEGDHPRPGPDQRRTGRGAVPARLPAWRSSRSTTPTATCTEFRKVVLAFTRDNPLGEDLFNDETKVEASFKQLRKSLERLTDSSRAGESWRRSVFDAREHVTFRAIETPGSGKPIVHEGVSGMSGGEGQELIAFILGAAPALPPRRRRPDASDVRLGRA